MDDTMTDEELLEAARVVREKAYCPYSDFHVDAAILDDNGQVHVGCNVENAAYPQGSCAEAGAMAAKARPRLARLAAAADSEFMSLPMSRHASSSKMTMTTGTPTLWMTYCRRRFIYR